MPDALAFIGGPLSIPGYRQPNLRLNTWSKTARPILALGCVGRPSQAVFVQVNFLIRKVPPKKATLGRTDKVARLALLDT